jgi:glycosyltransferase involved in cell wall biosynthesis
MAQTYTNWECIIVDDGSTDNTDEVVNEYVKNDNRFKYYHRPKEHLAGGNGARNFGFKMSKGEYVNWFDSDDLMLPEKLEFKLKALLNNDVDFVVCEGAILNKEGDIRKIWNNIHSDNVLIDHVYGNILFSTNGPLFKKKVISSSELFNEKLKRKQEWEYYSRILCSNQNYMPVKQILYHVKIFDLNAQEKIKKNSIYSKVLANILVFKRVNPLLEKNLSLEFRIHFLRKFIHNFYFSKRHLFWNAFFLSFYGVFYVLDLELIKHYIKKYSSNHTN